MQQENIINNQIKEKESISSKLLEEDNLSSKEKNIIPESTEEKNIFFFSNKYFFWKTIFIFLVFFFKRLFFDSWWWHEEKVSLENDLFMFYSFYLNPIFVSDLVYYLTTKIKKFKNYFFLKIICNILIIWFNFSIMKHAGHPSLLLFELFSYVSLFDLICFIIYILFKKNESEII